MSGEFSCINNFFKRSSNSFLNGQVLGNVSEAPDHLQRVMHMELYFLIFLSS